MKKDLSSSRKAAAKTLYATFKILKQNGGSLRGSEVIDKIRETVKFNDWEKHVYEKSGYVRWESILHFYTIDCIKAGFLQKDKGIWILTTEGEEALKLGEEGILDAASKAYKKWKLENKTSEEKEIIELQIEESFDQRQKALLEQYEEKAYEGIRNYVMAKNPYEFQKLIADLLETMGYFISHISPKGRDGGIDIIAYTDPLGTKPPRIIVQVKHRPDSSIASDDIQKLIGTMKRDTDVGIFATSGEFSQPAKVEARLSGKHIELIDFNRFVDLWSTYYDKMKDTTKNSLPLYPIYFLGTNE